MRMIINSDQDRNEFVRRLQAVNLGSRTYIAEFKLFRKQRTLKQNRLYRMWLQCIKDETGNDTESLHTYFKKYLPWKTTEVFGEEVKQVTSTTQLDTKEFTEYLDKIKAEMIDQGIYLPVPGEPDFDSFYAHYGVE